MWLLTAVQNADVPSGFGITLVPPSDPMKAVPSERMEMLVGIFGSSPATPGNMLTSGMTEQSNSNDDAAILTVDDLMPGEYQSGAVTIDNVGDSAGDFTLEASNLVDDPATPALSRVLTLAVTHGSNVVYNGPLSDFRSLDLGTWPADTRV